MRSSLLSLTTLFPLMLLLGLNGCPAGDDDDATGDDDDASADDDDTGHDDDDTTADDDDDTGHGDDDDSSDDDDSGDDDDTGHGDDDDTAHGDDDDSTGDDDDTAHGDDDDSAASSAVWTGDIQTILNAYCGSCHSGSATGSGGIGWLNSYADVTAIAGNTPACGAPATRASCIPARIQAGSMPATGACLPGDSGCITLVEFARLQAWVAAGAPEN